MTFLRSSLSLIALVWAALAAPAHATPIYFKGNLGVGFSAADPDVIAAGVDVVVDGSYAFVAALDVTTALVGDPTVPGTIDEVTPITAVVQYTVTNTTGSVLDDEHLVFTYAGDLALYPELSHDEFGIDVPGLVLIQQASCTGNPGGPCVFGAVALPVMAPGAIFQFQMVHAMADTLSGSTLIPSPSVAMLERTAAPPAVPEPAAAFLVAVGLAAILRRRR